MTTQNALFSGLPTGLTLTKKVFTEVDPDTEVTGITGAVTERTNAKGQYVVAVTKAAVISGIHTIILFVGSTPVAIGKRTFAGTDGETAAELGVELDSAIQTQLNAIEDGVDGANGYLTTLVGRITSSAAALFVNLAAMITGSGGTAKFTTLALEDAPGGGESGTDWTPEERAEIRYRLAMSGTATAPPEPDVDPIVITPATGIMTTGWLVTRVKGVPTADITIRYRQGLEPNGGTGSSYDSDTYEAKSSSEGIAELSLVKGGQYYIWRGFGQKPANADLILVPSDAGTSYALPSHVGD